MALSVRAALLGFLLATAAGMQIKEKSGAVDPADLERRAAEMEAEIAKMRALASKEREQQAPAAAAASDGPLAPNATTVDIVRNESAENLERPTEKALEKEMEASMEAKQAKARDAQMAKKEAQMKQAIPEVAAPAPRAAPRRAVTSAKGDPHLVNMMGQRFDIARSGDHLLIQVPRQAPKEATLLRVQGTVERTGGACADMYFTSINITGHWVHSSEGLHYSVRDFIVKDEMKWTSFGPLSVKVVHGHTHGGIQYLNFFVKNLGRVKYHVGGLMGEDDHTEVATPAEGCRRVLSLLQVQAREEAESQVPSVAVAEM